MFEPNLDSTRDWVLVTKFASELSRHNQKHNCRLSIRADALRVKVEIENNVNSWHEAGNLIQFWQPQQENYQVAYQKVYLSRQTIVSIEPLGVSLLEFVPVPWLHSWELTIHAREYEPIKPVLSQGAKYNQFAGNSKSNTNLEFL